MPSPSRNKIRANTVKAVGAGLVQQDGRPFDGGGGGGGGTDFEPLVCSNSGSPEIVFYNGDIVMVHVGA